MSSIAIREWMNRNESMVEANSDLIRDPCGGTVIGDLGCDVGKQGLQGNPDIRRHLSDVRLATSIAARPPPNLPKHALVKLLEPLLGEDVRRFPRSTEHSRRSEGDVPLFSSVQVTSRRYPSGDQLCLIVRVDRARPWRARKDGHHGR
jgi:hypothetical protein